MRLHLCGCTCQYEVRLITQSYRIAGRLVVVDRIPAEVCSLCGDTLITPEAARLIEDLVKSAGEPQETAPVYRLAAG